MKWLYRLWWSVTDRCKFCGSSRVEDYIGCGEYLCMDCDEWQNKFTTAQDESPSDPKNAWCTCGHRYKAHFGNADCFACSREHRQDACSMFHERG